MRTAHGEFDERRHGRVVCDEILEDFRTSHRAAGLSIRIKSTRGPAFEAGKKVEFLATLDLVYLGIQINCARIPCKPILHRTPKFVFRV